MLLSRGIDGQPLQALNIFQKTSCSILSSGRQDIVTMAVEGDFTHLLFLDDDMVFPADTVARLAGHAVPVVGVNYRHKTQGDRKITARDTEGKYLESHGRTGLERAGRMGLGVVLVEVETFRRVPAPHFEILYSPVVKIYRSDDYAMCDKFRDAGVEMFVDHGLSNECGHVGEYIYRLDSPA